MAAGRAFLAAHPDVAKVLVARCRARALSRYGALFTTLGLTPTQITQFEDIIMQGEGWGPVPSPTGPLQLQVGPTHANDAEIESQLQTLLGDADYAKTQQFVQMMPAHMLTTQLASALYFTDSPLTAGQADQLKQIYAATAAGGTGGGQSSVSLLRQAQGVLSPEQFAALTGIVQQEQFDAALSREVRQ